MTARAQVELPVIRYKPSGYSVGMRADGEGRYVDYFDYAALVARLAESEARAVAAEANDRRYRWLRDPANNESVSNLIAIYDYGDEALLMDGDDLDAAIDAAMKQEAEREAGSA